MSKVKTAANILTKQMKDWMIWWIQRKNTYVDPCPIAIIKKEVTEKWDREQMLEDLVKAADSIAFAAAPDSFTEKTIKDNKDNG